MISAPYLTGEITAPTTATAWSIALGNLVAPGETAPAPAALTVVLWNGSDQKITSASVVLSDSHAAGATTAADVKITYALPSVAVPAVASGSPGTQNFAPLALVAGLLPTLTVTGALAAAATSGSIRVGVYLHTAGASSLPQSMAATTSITAGGTAQSLFAALANRAVFTIQNPSTATGQGITTAESLWIQWGADATTAPPSFEVVTGATIILDTKVDPRSISIIAATTGHAFYASQG